jgi:transcriptional regulator with XRE-family HTH domain/tetratricopeptide (TPR) repeat protein
MPSESSWFGRQTPGALRREGSGLAERTVGPFGRQLRELRLSAHMTQEELAEASGVSARSVSDLERGITPTARRETARLLADALGLTGAARLDFLLAARGQTVETDRRSTSSGVVPRLAVATRTLPRDVVSLTGRDLELQRLLKTAQQLQESGGAVSIYAIGGMAGVGKTAFAVHAAHVLAAQFPDGQIFLPLHGHTPGQLPVDPQEALSSLLQTAGVAAELVPTDLDSRIRMWRNHLAGKRMLIVLDDATGHAQVRPLLPGTSGSMVLITSRRRLTALEDTHAISLDALSPPAAAALFVQLAGQLDLHQEDSAVTEIAELCGHLPLAIGIMARKLHHHPAWTAADLAADLVAARDRLEFMAAEDLSVAAAFRLSYGDLTRDQQQLFSYLGLHPGSDFDALAAAALSARDLVTTRRELEALYDRYLISEPARGRYRMHDLLRDHARTLAAAGSASEDDAAIDRLIGYYAHSAYAAGKYLARWKSAGVPAIDAGQPAETPAFLAVGQADTWIGTELPNLLAVAEYADQHGRAATCVAICAAVHGYLRRNGKFAEGLLFHRTALSSARRLASQAAEAFALTATGDTNRLSGDSFTAIKHLSEAATIYAQLGDALGEANALNELAAARYYSGDYSTAFTELNRALELYRAAGDKLGEAHTLNHLGAVQSLSDDYAAAEQSHLNALVIYRQLDYVLGEANATTELGIAHRMAGNYAAAITSLFRGLELARALEYKTGEADALIELGAAQLMGKQESPAKASLLAGLEKSKGLGYRVGEANALSYLGLMPDSAGHPGESLARLERALWLCRELGDKLKVARALNTIGEKSPAASARTYHDEALIEASGIGSRSEQARALEGIGRCHLRLGEAAEATAALEEALATYRGISSPRASDVEQQLRALRMRRAEA